MRELEGLLNANDVPDAMVDKNYDEPLSLIDEVNDMM